MPGFRVEGLGVRNDRADVPGAQLAGLGLDQLREVGFPVHGPDFREGPAQREGELAGTAGQVKQPPLAGDPGARDQVLDHCLRVWQPVAVVILGGPLVEVGREVQLIVHGPSPLGNGFLTCSSMTQNHAGGSGCHRFRGRVMVVITPAG